MLSRTRTSAYSRLGQTGIFENLIQNLPARQSPKNLRKSACLSSQDELRELLRSPTHPGAAGAKNVLARARACGEAVGAAIRFWFLLSLAAAARHVWRAVFKALSSRPAHTTSLAVHCTRETSKSSETLTHLHPQDGQVHASSQPATSCRLPSHSPVPALSPAGAASRRRRQPTRPIGPARSANLATIVLEHERRLDHVRERTHLPRRRTSAKKAGENDGHPMNLH